MLLSCCPASAAEHASIEELRRLSLRELQEVQVTTSISSIEARPIREQPGIVTVLGREEIRARGARDLAELMVAVPGFGLGHDVQSVIGPTFRGLWAHEGKTQLIVDGIEFNESLYGTIQLGGHLSAEQIEQVEIIRGPGSVRYGGTAELAVIRVTTRGSKLNGGYAVLTPETTATRVGQSFNAGVGYELADWRLSATAYHAQNFRSDGTFTDLEGDQATLARVSDLTPWNVNLGLGWKGLDVRLIYDRYEYEDLVDYGDLLAAPNRMGFESWLLQGEWRVQAAEGVEVTPTVRYRRQTPWQVAGPAGGYEVGADRWSVDVPTVIRLGEPANLLVGGRYQHDAAEAFDAAYYGDNAATLLGGEAKVSYDTWAAYAQVDLDSRWVNVSAGGRFEHHSLVGGQFVPRVALTRAWNRFHLKALFAQAYRTPNIGVIADAVVPALLPETTTTYELEAGYEFPGGVTLVGNVFSLRIDDPLIYSAVLDGYFNDRRVGSFGTEVELRVRQERWQASLGHSWYLATDNDVALYQSGDPDRFLGTPAHKLTFSFTAQLRPWLDWNLNGAILGPRAAIRFPELVPADLDTEFQLNTYVEARWRRVRFGLGVANVLDENLVIPQPYAGGAAPLPAKGRQYFLKAGYEF